MSIVVDQQYASMLGPYVQNLRKSKNGWAFSCPFCVTPSKQLKANVFRVGNMLMFHCHKCSTSLPFGAFLSRIDKNLCSHHAIDTLKDTTPDEKQLIIKRPEFVDSIDKTLIKVSTLPPYHKCKQYITDRQIPSNKHYLLYYTDDFAKFAARVDKSVDCRQEPRLVIPLITENQTIAGYQGRALTNDSIKYLTVLYNQDNGKLFGLDRIDFNKKKYIFEGPLDALFIDNSIAATGGRIDSAIEHTAIDKQSSVVVYDNEPRSKFTVAKMEKALDHNFNICIWPSNIKENDINEMVLAGRSPVDIQTTIDTHTYNGLLGKLQLEAWRKI